MWYSSRSSRTVSVQIYTSDSKDPPYRRDESISPLCNITCKIDIPWEDMHQFTDSRGKIHYRLDDLRLTMKFEGEPSGR